MLGACGASSRSSPSRFATSSAFWLLIPVALPPGRLRLATSPSSTGSSAIRKKIGMVEVAALAARVAGVLDSVAMTETGFLTSSSASSGSFAFCPLAQRYSTATFWPSTKPALCKPRLKPASRLAFGSSEAECRKPMTGIAPCARTVIGNNGEAAAPPSSVMNARRFMDVFPTSRRTSILAGDYCPLNRLMTNRPPTIKR